jgi:hypothetical protein
LGRQYTTTWLFLIAATTACAALLSGCEVGAPIAVAATPAAAAIPAKADSAQCGTARPAACVVACGQLPTGLEPTCSDGRWHCEGGVPSTQCPAFTGLCGDSAACGWGYHCVESLSHPVPADSGICRKGIVHRDYDVESCGPQGTIAPGEFLTQKQVYLGQVVKLSGTVDVDIKCSNNACGEDACCNACVGNYKIMVKDPAKPDHATAVTVSMQTLACNGTTCDVACGPLDVGGAYTVWGILDKCHGTERCTMLYMGGCPL